MKKCVFMKSGMIYREIRLKSSISLKSSLLENLFAIIFVIVAEPGIKYQKNLSKNNPSARPKTAFLRHLGASGSSCLGFLGARETPPKI